MNNEMFNFIDDVVNDKNVHAPVYSDAADSRCRETMQDYASCTRGGVDALCTNIGYAKHKDWSVPSVERVRFAVVDTKYFPSWAAKNGMSEKALTSHYTYARHVLDKQAESLWKKNKFSSPVSVCCIVVSVEDAAMQKVIPLSLKTQRELAKVLKKHFGKHDLSVLVSDRMVASDEMYSNISKYKNDAYKAFGLPCQEHTTKRRLEKYAPDRDRSFFCIPVYIKEPYCCTFSVDLFYSLQSSMLSMDAKELNPILLSIDGHNAEVVWNYLIPVDAIPELGEVLCLKKGNATEQKTKVKAFLNELVSYKDPVYMDIVPLGDMERISRLSYVPGGDLREFGKQAIEGIIGMLSSCGGYVFVAVDKKSENRVQIYGVAADCLNGWRSVPVRYLKQIYSPMADGRRFESLNVDYVDAADHNPRYLRDA